MVCRTIQLRLYQLYVPSHLADCLKWKVLAISDSKMDIRTGHAGMPVKAGYAPRNTHFFVLVMLQVITRRKTNRNYLPELAKHPALGRSIA